MTPTPIGDDDALLATLAAKLGIKTREGMLEMARHFDEHRHHNTPTRTRLEPLRSGSQPTSEAETVDALEQHLRRIVGMGGWL